MIDGILIAGFKAFPLEWNYLPIRPITLVFGQNAAGKSTLLQFIAWMQHVHSGGRWNATSLEACGRHVNLGGFDHFLNRTEDTTTGGPFYIPGVIGMGWGFRFEDPIQTPEFQPGIEGKNPDKGGAAWRLVYEVMIDGIHGVRILCGPISIGWALVEGSIRFSDFWACESGGETDDLENSNRLLPDSIRSYMASVHGSKVDLSLLTDDWCDEFSECVRQYLMNASFQFDGLGPILRAPSKEETVGPELAHDFLRNLQAAMLQMQSDLSQFLTGLTYLGPWRKIPELSDLSRSGGEKGNQELALWNQLREDRDIQSALNEWLLRFGFDIEIVSRDLVDREELRRRILAHWKEIHYLLDQVADVPYGQSFMDDKGFDSLPEVLKKDHYVASCFKELVDCPSSEIGLDLRILPSHVKIAPGDTGVGISQLVPLIIGALSSPNRTWLVEQPELHLHPKAQALIGDLLIQATVASRGGDHCFIIETHSEHLILRLLRRVRETCQLFLKNDYPLHPDELSVVYVGKAGLSDMPGMAEHYENVFKAEVENPLGAPGSVDAGISWVKNSYIREIKITPAGDFDIKWPGGFFEERLDELFSEDERRTWRQS